MTIFFIDIVYHFYMLVSGFITTTILVCLKHGPVYFIMVAVLIVVIFELYVPYTVWRVSNEFCKAARIIKNFV